MKDISSDSIDLSNDKRFLNFYKQCFQEEGKFLEDYSKPYHEYLVNIRIKKNLDECIEAYNSKIAFSISELDAQYTFNYQK